MRFERLKPGEVLTVAGVRFVVAEISRGEVKVGFEPVITRETLRSTEIPDTMTKIAGPNLPAAKA